MGYSFQVSLWQTKDRESSNGQNEWTGDLILITKKNM